MKQRLIRCASLAFAGLVLASCGSADADLQKFAKKQKMSEVQTAAFISCANNLRKNKPSFVAKDGNLIMKSVPNAICACQVQTITAVFAEDRFKSYSTFAEYMAKDVKKRPPRFSKKDLKEGLTSLNAAKKLEASLNSCIDGYKTKFKEQSAELFELKPLPQQEKKTAGAAG